MTRAADDLATDYLAVAIACPERDDGPLRSVSIAMGVLGCFEHEAELGATRVAAELGVAKSTASRMLAALASSGMLERSRSGRYRLGLRLFEIGQLAVDRLMLRELALPVLGELRDVLRETAQLAVPVGADVLYVDRLEGSGVGTMFHTELYRRGPGHSSSAGKAMAAFNPTMARADPRPRLRAADAVHDRRPGPLPAGAAAGPSGRLRGLPGGAHAGHVLDRGAGARLPRRAADRGRGDLRRRRDGPRAGRAEDRGRAECPTGRRHGVGGAADLFVNPPGRKDRGP
jgi:hypothetical protein